MLELRCDVVDCGGGETVSLSLEERSETAVVPPEILGELPIGWTLIHTWGPTPPPPDRTVSYRSFHPDSESRETIEVEMDAPDGLLKAKPTPLLRFVLCPACTQNLPKLKGLLARKFAAAAKKKRRSA